LGRSIDYCAACGDRIQAADLEKGKAVAVADQVYCPKCRDKAPASAPGTGGNGKPRAKTGSTGTFPAIRTPSHGLRAAGPATQRLAPVPSTQRLASLAADEAAPQRPNRMPLIAGAVAGVILLAAVILFAVQSSKDRAIAEAERKRVEDAKASYEAILKFRQANPEDADGILKLVEEAAKKCKNTEFSGKVAYERGEAEALKKAQDLKKSRKATLEGLRAQVATSKDLGALAEQAKKFGDEMKAQGGDAELAQAAAALAKSILEKRALKAIDATKEFEGLNPDKYDEIQRMWTDAMTLCDGDGLASLQKQCLDRLNDAKKKKDAAAWKAWETCQKFVETNRKKKQWDIALKEIENFTNTWKGTAAVDEAVKLSWEIDAERKSTGTGTKPPPDPNKSAPKEWTQILGPGTTGGWKEGGANIKWAWADGAATGTNTISAEEAAKDPSKNSMGFIYTEKAYSGYEVEVEFTLVKGEGLIAVGVGGVDQNPPAIPIRSSKKGDGAQIIAESGKPYTMSARVMADAISVNGAGLTGGNWRFQGGGDGKDHGGGAFAIAVQPESEVKVTKVRIRAIP
jgi:hypothetical protein